MNICGKLSSQFLKKERARTFATIFAIIISTVLFTSITSMTYSMLSYLKEGTIYEFGNYHLEYLFLNDEEKNEVEKKEDVESISDFGTIGYIDSDLMGDRSLVVAANDEFFKNMPVHLVKGRLPQNSFEILINNQEIANLESKNISCEIGKQVTFKMTTLQSESLNSYYPLPESHFSKTYTIVGIADYDQATYENVVLNTYFTKMDKDCGPILWHRCFIKLKNPRAAYAMQRSNTANTNINDSLLRVIGQSEADNTQFLIYAFMAIVCVIIMVCSITMISNSFSISIVERTRQFGLFSSIGATRKQIRYLLFYEAGILCAIAVPIGMCVGLVISNVLVQLFGTKIETKFTFNDYGVVHLKLMVYIPILLLAVLLVAVTVFLSVYIPARRAMSISPIEAIRQTNDYKISNTESKSLGKSHLGVVPQLARKNYSVCRRRYLNTIISLGISVILVFGAISIGNNMEGLSQSEMNLENFDFDVFEYNENPVKLETLKNQSFVKKSVKFLKNDRYCIKATEKDFDEKFLDIWKESVKDLPKGFQTLPAYLDILYLEDEAYEQFLKDEGLDPAMYLDLSKLVALPLNVNKTLYYYTNSKEMNKTEYINIPVLKETINTVEVWDFLVDETINMEGELRTQSVDEKGNVILKIYAMADDDRPAKEYQMKILDEDGDTAHVGYYEYDSKLMKCSDTKVAEGAGKHYILQIGQRINRLPYGISTQGIMVSPSSLTVLLPMSASKGWQYTSDKSTHLSITVSDYEKAKDYLDSHELLYEDYMGNEYNSRGLVQTVQIFALLFIIAILLICAANVFNTISTNYMLRKREYGMLQSMGMQKKQMKMMAAYECMMYGFRALVWSVPVGLIIDYMIYCLSRTMIDYEYQFPITSVIISISLVVFVILVSIIYSLSRLKRQCLMDAIRIGEN
ncbi:ABC transporter ATP-binding protein [Lachnospiraceae bacterium TWA4]|nr:ABC transporter ATP-binding protein [Lachnospiraceae bacterium TWA4]